MLIEHESDVPPRFLEQFEDPIDRLVQRDLDDRSEGELLQLLRAHSGFFEFECVSDRDKEIDVIDRSFVDRDP